MRNAQLQKVAHLSGVAHMAASTRAAFGHGPRDQYGKHLARYRVQSFPEAMVALSSIEGFAKVLTMAIAKHITIDGRMDPLDVARTMLEEVLPFMRPGAQRTFEERLDDIRLLTDLSSLLLEAIEKTQQKDGKVETMDVARFCFARMGRVR